MKILGVIPARFQSSRFPGKPLADIMGSSMIMRVFQQAKKAKLLSEVVVATDDERIYKHVQDAGGNVHMTSPSHPTGTDRVIEVSDAYSEYDAYINIQGDEPFISPEQVDKVASIMLNRSGAFVATLIKRIQNPELIENPNIIKVVRSHEGRAMYFSRSPIPYTRNNNSQPVYFKHIGIYGYSAKALPVIREMPHGMLEQCEMLEQLRWMEQGMPVWTAETNSESISVDTPEDLERIKATYFPQ